MPISWDFLDEWHPLLTHQPLAECSLKPDNSLCKFGVSGGLLSRSLETESHGMTFLCIKRGDQNSCLLGDKQLITGLCIKEVFKCFFLYRKGCCPRSGILSKRELKRSDYSQGENLDSVITGLRAINKALSFHIKINRKMNFSLLSEISIWIFFYLVTKTIWRSSF